MILQWLEVVPEVLSKMYSLPWLYFRSTTNSTDYVWLTLWLSLQLNEQLFTLLLTGEVNSDPN